ncbi:hypothetical protein ID859_17510, partial [Xenorhabdus sp. 38]|nr:hypothetical protein [Xenorhabdus sp. 38]
MRKSVAFAAIVMLIALFVMTRHQAGEIESLKSDNASLSTQLSAQKTLITSQEARIKHLSEIDTTR